MQTRVYRILGLEIIHDESFFFFLKEDEETVLVSVCWRGMSCGHHRCGKRNPFIAVYTVILRQFMIRDSTVSSSNPCFPESTGSGRPAGFLMSRRRLVGTNERSRIGLCSRHDVNMWTGPQPPHPDIWNFLLGQAQAGELCGACMNPTQLSTLKHRLHVWHAAPQSPQESRHLVLHTSNPHQLFYLFLFWHEATW